MKLRAALPVGTEIGNYVIADVLGQGGSAVTYYATDTLLGREVALKEHFPQGLCRRMPDGSVASLPGLEEVFEQSVDVFLNEARTVAGLNHRHIVPIHDVLGARGTAYAVLELEEGELLDAWLHAHAAEPRRVQRVLEALLEVLAYLHERCVYHRDIKPANIMVREGDDPVLLDFGAAHVGDFTGERTIVGTPAFAAPEQFAAVGEVGPWSDLYALGSSFLQAMGAEVAAALPRRLRASLYKATRRQPEQRFRSAEEWRRALKPVPFRQWGVAALLGVAAVAGMGGWLLWPVSTVEDVAAAQEAFPEVNPAELLRSLNGYTMQMELQGNVCYQSMAELQHWEQMEEAEVIGCLKSAFFDPASLPIQARINPDYLSFDEQTWRAEDSESAYCYKRLEGSALSLLIVTDAEGKHRMPYLMWFCSPTEGLLAFPVANGLNVWSRVPFRLMPNAEFEAPSCRKVAAPESPEGHYLLWDRSQMQRYAVAPDSAAGPNREAEKERVDISPVESYAAMLFTDAEHWQSGELRGTYAYERLSQHQARLTLHPQNGENDLSLFLHFHSGTSGRLHLHRMGEAEAYGNITFEMHPFGVAPRGLMFNCMFNPEDLRPPAETASE